MFKFHMISNQATGEQYWISNVQLVNAEGPACLTGENVDVYSIDLESTKLDGAPLYDIDLIQEGDTYHITQGLNPANQHIPTKQIGHFQSKSQPAFIEGDTLIVPRIGIKQHAQEQ